MTTDLHETGKHVKMDVNFLKESSMPDQSTTRTDERKCEDVPSKSLQEQKYLKVSWKGMQVIQYEEC